MVGGAVFLANQRPQGNRTTEEGKMVAGYSGKVLAGSTSPYIVFNKVDYEKALQTIK